MLLREDHAKTIERLRGPRSQKEVAKRAGISRSEWSKYENAKRTPTPRRLKEICKGLQCTESEYLAQAVRVYEERTGTEVLATLGPREGTAYGELVRQLLEPSRTDLVNRLLNGVQAILREELGLQRASLERLVTHHASQKS